MDRNGDIIIIIYIISIISISTLYVVHFFFRATTMDQSYPLAKVFWALESILRTMTSEIAKV